MKKILAILIALLAALAVQTVAFADGEVTEIEPTTTVSEDDETTKTLNAQNKDDQGLTYTLNNDGTATVSGCDRTVTSIKIPSNVESNGQTYTVTSIGNRAFANCYITSVDIPDSVISIDSYAFASCHSLTSVTIPGSITSIGGYAFGGCSSLTEVTIPDSVTVIDSGTFIECTDLTSVDIPDGGQQYRHRNRFRPHRPADGGRRAPRPAGRGGHQTVQFLDGRQGRPARRR